MILNTWQLMLIMHSRSLVFGNSSSIAHNWYFTIGNNVMCHRWRLLTDTYFLTTDGCSALGWGVCFPKQEIQFYLCVRSEGGVNTSNISSPPAPPSRPVPPVLSCPTAPFLSHPIPVPPPPPTNSISNEGWSYRYLYYNLQLFQAHPPWGRIRRRSHLK